MKLSFEAIGAGKPVVLIHAFPLSRKMWKNQAEVLKNNGFRVILPDLPGFGESIQSPQQFSIQEMATQIKELLDSLNIEKAIIGGLSMGGYILFNLYRIAPEYFAGMILCDTTDLADTDEKRSSRFELISKIEKEGARSLVENMLPNLISETTKQNNPALRDRLENYFLEVKPQAAIDALQSMAERNDCSDLLDKISVPALLVFGREDKITNLENAQKMRRSIPESKLVIIEKAGHYSNLEQPEQFNEAMLDFCRRIEY